MSDKERPEPSPEPPPEQAPLRPLTKQLIEAIALDMWPGSAAVVDFGLDSQEHYEALYYPVRNGEITPAQLEAALGKGPKLTELVNNAPGNPHKGIVFRTGWDEMHASLAREVFDAAVEAAYAQARDEPLGGLTLRAPEQGVAREAYGQDMEEKHWGEWEKEAWGYNIGQLHGMAGDYHDRLEGLAMQELSEGLGAAAERSPAANYEAMLRDYRESTSIHYEEEDGTHRTWAELSPEGKLGYLARDAAVAGATGEHFAKAVGELLGELSAAEREAVALSLVLRQAGELHAIARLVPDHYSNDQLPLAEQVRGALGGQKSVLGYDLAGPSPAPPLASRLAEQLGVTTDAPTPGPDRPHDRGRGGR